MRVIAGRAKSLKLRTPEGTDTRPTTDRIKETLFNILQGELTESIFVDLFAGSGGIGIEALSRGAGHAYFVENQREALACIRDNLAFTGFSDQATVLRQDILSALPLIREKKADIIFMDPPYQSGLEEKVFEVLSHMPYVTGDTLLILEADIRRETDFLELLGYQVIREKNYKTNKHVFARKRGDL